MSSDKKQVLLVDDSPKLMKFIEVHLKTHGFDVTSASSGIGALEKARTESPDVMVLDLRMPDMDGFEVLEKLREFSDLPVIACSATPEFSDLALKSGANAFVAKPFNMDEFIELIADLSGRHR